MRKLRFFVILNSYLLVLLMGCDSSLSEWLESSAAIESDLAWVTEPEILTPGPVDLAKLVQLSTNMATRLEVWVDDGHGHKFRVNYPTYSQSHAEPLLGFRAGRDYRVWLTVTSTQGQSLTWYHPAKISTHPLPEDVVSVKVKKHNFDRMEPGYTLLDSKQVSINLVNFNGLQRKHTILVVDREGEVVWYLQPPSNGTARQLDNGLIQANGLDGEVDVFGNPVASILFPDNQHHDYIQMPTLPGEEDRFLAITSANVDVDDYPYSADQEDLAFYVDPNGPATTSTVNVRYDNIVEFHRDGTMLQTWNLLDMLKPTRVGFFDGGHDNLGPRGADWGHSNSVWYHEADDSIIVCVRQQDAIIKFSRATGQLRWILGPHGGWEGFEDYLLTPVPIGGEFEWAYHPHSAMVTQAGGILLFDNGNYRATPFTGEIPLLSEGDPDSYSRAIEYRIDETAMKVAQAWEYSYRQGGERWPSWAQGDADELPETGNRLMVFNYCPEDFINQPGLWEPTECGSQVVEVTKLKHQKVFELALYVKSPWVFDGQQDPQKFVTATTYRAERIPLYPDNQVRVTWVANDL